jgi:cephalosporin hydroxylase
LKKEFVLKNNKVIKAMSKDLEFKKQSQKWFEKSLKYEYSYHFSWLGRPIIQYPQDILAIQEIIWKTKPDLIIETGIAHGGSLILSASMLELIGKGEVLGIDIDIRKHNKQEIEKHPMFKRITMIEGSSIDIKIIKKVQEFAKNRKKIMVILDSNHTHDHVVKELQAYSPLVSKGNYLLVFDTIIEDVPEEYSENRSWGINNNPKTAVKQFLKKNDRFKIDKKIEEKLLFTVAPSGYLKCTKNISTKLKRSTIS